MVNEEQGERSVSCLTGTSGVPGLLSQVMDQIPDELALLDLEGRMTEINRAGALACGAVKEACLGQPCRFWLDGGPNEAAPAPGEAVFLENLGRAAKGEFIQSKVDPQGRLHYFRVLSWPVLDAKGRLACTVVMRRDITQRTFMERRLLQSEKLAAVGELSTFIAHEIRNPLFAIAGFANSLLRSANLDEKSQEKVVIILEEASRLDQILKSILNFARPTQGKTGQAEVAALASQTMDLMRLCCVKQSVEIRVEVAQGLPMAKGDPELIKQCLINLIKNSLEAMPDGGVLTLRCQMLGDQIAVEIEDTGRGIAAENLDQVFNPFFSTKDKGSGLGLAMTKKILDELGGGVELSSRQGKGTVVRLLLPPVLAGMEEDRDPDGPAWGMRGAQ